MRALLARCPGVATLPLAALQVAETPVQRFQAGGVSLLVKRDDLSAPRVGGNKVRALQFLLGGAAPGVPLLTVGATGSTHALAVAAHGASIGLATQVITWPQEEHAVSRATAARMRELAQVTHAGSVVAAYLRAASRRLHGGVRWIPAGGSTALGVVGHAAAAMELVEQLVRSGEPMPEVIVVPLGTGGTAAGLLLGLALAGSVTRVVGVQVVPRVVARHAHVVTLARQARALLASHSESPLAALDPARLEIDREAYGGTYGRETPAGRDAAAALARAGGPLLDPTYSAKAFAVALERARRPGAGTVLFWLTFDGRWLDATANGSREP